MLIILFLRVLPMDMIFRPAVLDPPVIDKISPCIGKILVVLYPTNATVIHDWAWALTLSM